MAVIRCSLPAGAVLSVHEMVDEGIGTGSKIARACPEKDIALKPGENDVPEAAWAAWCTQFKPERLPGIMAIAGIVRIDGGPQQDDPSPHAH